MVVAAFEFGHNMYGFLLMWIFSATSKATQTFLEIKHMSFRSTLLYSSLHLTSVITNSPSKATSPSGVVPK